MSSPRLRSVFAALWHRPLVIVLLAPLCALSSVRAQESRPTEPSAAATVRAVQDPVQRAALLDLAKDLEATQQTIAEAKEELAKDPRDSSQRDRIRELEARVKELDGQFSTLLVGASLSEATETTAKFDLQAEVERLLQPLVQQIKDATAAPREIENMRTRVDLLTDQINGGRRTIERAKAAERAAAGDDADTKMLREQIAHVRGAWEQYVRGLEQERTVVSAQLQNRIDEQKSFVDSAGEVLGTFFRTRGLNLLLATIAFIAVFSSLRFVQRRIQRVTRGRKGRRFPARLLDVVLQVLVVIAAIGAVLGTLYAVSDWLLLAVTLVFLLGAGWAAIRMLPQYFEQLRLMLNLGSVREGERIHVDGLPWRVESLKFYSTLANPALRGGILRVPLRDLVGQRSRPMAQDEPWFPCKVGDVVVLGDGTRGQVLDQTPDVVVLAVGGERSYKTSDFLGQTPRNLTVRGFNVEVVFGVDYAHQPQVTRDIPAKLKAILVEQLPESIDAKLIRSVNVEFREAGASSLDIAAAVDLDGAAAPQFAAVQRALWRIVTDTCTAQGWEIPFPQMTVHQRSA